MPNTPRQSQNSDNTFTELDLKVFRVIVIFDSKHDIPMLVGSIVANLSDENEEDVLVSINKIRLAGYIYKVTSTQNEMLGYSPSDKGSQWFHENNR